MPTPATARASIRRARPAAELKTGKLKPRTRISVRSATREEIASEGTMLGAALGATQRVMEYNAASLNGDFLSKGLRLPVDSARDISVKSTRTLAKWVGRGAFGLNIVIGGLDAKNAYSIDRARGDRYYTETTKSVSGTSMSLVLGATAGTVAVAVGTAALPALALGVGAGMAGYAIGQEIGKGVVALRRWWNGA